MKTTTLRNVCGALAIFGASFSASAAMITDNSGFGGGSSLVTFDEVALTNGTIVTNQFSPYGVSFTPNLAIDSGRSTSGFSGQNLQNYSPEVNPFSIIFTETVSAFGAYWETDNSNALTFSAFLSGGLVESFTFTETNCCQTGSFLGFSNILFNEVQVSTSGTHSLIMDNLQYSASSPSAVPVPAAVWLMGSGLLGLMGFNRKNKKLAA